MIESQSFRWWKYLHAPRKANSRHWRFRFSRSHLCERLLNEGANVICVDNFFSGTRSNIEHLLGHKRFELLRHDVTFPLHIEVDEIYNLACPASPIHYQRDQVQTT